MTDLLDPRLFAGGQPYAEYAWLREHDPVHWQVEPDGGPGFWALTRHADIKAVETDSETFSSEPTTVITDRKPIGDATHRHLIFSDPPHHTVHRRFLAPELGPVAVRSQRAAVEELVDAVIDEVVERGECDFVTDIAGRMASYVIADLLGLAREESLALFHASAVLTRGFPVTPGSAEEAAMETIYRHGAEAWTRSRAAAGAPGALARMAHGEIAGVPVDQFQFQVDFHLLVSAGSDTSRNVLATGMDALFGHPEQHALLVADPSAVPRAVEEMLRWTPPIVYQRRRATRDTEVAGVKVLAGEKVVSFYGAGNRDPRVFADPEVFDTTRAVNPHLSFGAGRHFCLGSHLARLELECMVTALVRRLPDLRPAGPLEWDDLPSVPSVLGPRSLPVTFTPGPRVGR